MAKKVMGELCEEVRAKWSGVRNVAIHHRLGPVGPKEASVVLAVTSVHRKDSLEAVRYAMDELKARVPIWKKEVYGGEAHPEWKKNKECKWADRKDKCDDEEPALDESLVQLTAPAEEINRRIDAFRQRKRAELDAANVAEFVGQLEDEDDQHESGCARVSSEVPQRSGSAHSHLRTTNVVNAAGPQTGDYVDAKRDDALRRTTKRTAAVEGGRNGQCALPAAIAERVEDLEAKVLVEGQPVGVDVYARLKALEDRVLFLEGLSPEYFQQPSQNGQRMAKTPNDAVTAADWTMSSEAQLATLNTRIQTLQDSLRAKAATPTSAGIHGQE